MAKSLDAKGNSFLSQLKNIIFLTVGAMITAFALESFLDTTKDNISVPSSEPSCFKIMPTPSPRIIPPKTVANNKSWVTL